MIITFPHAGTIGYKARTLYLAVPVWVGTLEEIQPSYYNPERIRMKKFLLPLLVIWLLVACTPSPSAPVAPAPTAQPLNLDIIPAGEAFAGMLKGNAPYNIQWFDLNSVPTDSGVTAKLRPDRGIDLRIDGTAMPVWKDGVNWVMSDNVNGTIVDFASGNLGAAGFKDGTVVYIRMMVNEWQVGIIKE